jgi:RNA polymerase sigma-70 factor (ECF subfamily)
MPHEEAATVMGVPLGTLKSHVARGREKLKNLLKDHAP